jgi:hypothetical protein
MQFFFTVSHLLITKSNTTTKLFATQEMALAPRMARGARTMCVGGVDTSLKKTMPTGRRRFDYSERVVVRLGLVPPPVAYCRVVVGMG